MKDAFSIKDSQTGFQKLHKGSNSCKVDLSHACYQIDQWENAREVVVHFQDNILINETTNEQNEKQKLAVKMRLPDEFLPLGIKIRTQNQSQLHTARRKKIQSTDWPQTSLISLYIKQKTFKQTYARTTRWYWNSNWNRHLERKSPSCCIEQPRLWLWGWK